MNLLGESSCAMVSRAVESLTPQTIYTLQYEPPQYNVVAEVLYPTIHLNVVYFTVHSAIVPPTNSRQYK